MADTAIPVITPATDTPEQEPETNGGSSKYLRPDELLRKWSVSLTNSTADSGILTALSKYGYDASRIAEGSAMHANVTGLFAKQKKEYGEQLDASAALSAAFSTSNAAYMPSIKIARIAFEGDINATAALLLSGARSKVISTWTRQADTFYRNLIANKDFVDKMAYYGYTVDKLNAEWKLVQDVAAADAKHKKERGESQEATVVRDNALAELESWMSRFYRVARIACAGQAQWLEKLGIKE
jgi:hypothetical protein